MKLTDLKEYRESRLSYFESKVDNAKESIRKAFEALKKQLEAKDDQISLKHIEGLTYELCVALGPPGRPPYEWKQEIDLKLDPLESKSHLKVSDVYVRFDERTTVPLDEPPDRFIGHVVSRIQKSIDKEVSVYDVVQ